MIDRQQVRVGTSDTTGTTKGTHKDLAGSRRMPTRLRRRRGKERTGELGSVLCLLHNTAGHPSRKYGGSQRQHKGLYGLGAGGPGSEERRWPQISRSSAGELSVRLGTGAAAQPCAVQHTSTRDGRLFKVQSLFSPSTLLDFNYLKLNKI